MKTNRVAAWRQVHGQAALQSLGDLCRHPVSSLMAWIIIAIALALPGVLALVLGNVKALNSNWQGNVPTLSVYLRTQSQPQQLSLQAEINRLPQVSSTRRISPEQALAHLQAVTQLTDLDQVLPKNPLPTVLVVRPRQQAVHEASLAQLKGQLARLRGVDFVQLDMRWVQRLLAFLQIGERLTGYLAVLLSLGVLLIVGNTIRLSLLRHRRDIDVLSLIGATAGFIRRPFLYRGFWLGLGGGVIACLLLLLLQQYLGGAVNHLADLYGSTFRLEGLSAGTSVYLILGSALLGILGARIACWRVRPSTDISMG
jgi:cell division transport system permease protein